MKKLFITLCLLSGITSYINAQNVTFQDGYFKNYLLARTDINTDLDNTEISLVEASAFTGTISCSSLGITDLTGIEAFVNLTELYITANPLTSLNLTANTKLTHFGCEDNQLTSLVLGSKPQLLDILCSNNQLTSLNISQCPSLNLIECNYNQLTSIDITQNLLLEGLSCNHNQLTGINTSNNTAMNYLYCNYNQITNLDMTQNSALKGIYCSYNQLTVLDLSQNSNLMFLDCYNNQLSFLNIQNGNNINFGGGAMFPAFFVYNNANPLCIQADNPAWMTTHFGSSQHIDSWATFSQSCAANFSCKWNKIKSNIFNSLAYRPDGSIFVWGANYYGQLGNGTSNLINNTPSFFDNSSNWKDLSISDVSFGIKQDGTLWAWGDNNAGNIIPHPNPAQIGTDIDWKKVSARYYHTLALKNNGTLWSLGSGVSNIPVQIGTDSDWKEIYTGVHFSFAIKNNGTLWAWGMNTQGQLGDGTTTDKTNPVQIGNDTDWKTISTSDSFVFALKNNGTLWRWGGFNSGLTPQNSLVPLQLGTDNDWKEISTLNQAMMAIKTNGTRWGIGQNGSGYLGNGTNNPIYGAMAQLDSDTDWKSLSSGSAHTLALKNDNTLWSWGLNIYGSLGNGNTTHSNIPIQICSVISFSTSETVKKKIILYPNPTTGLLHFQTTEKILSVKIHDLSGKLVKTSIINNNTINLEELPKGSYILEITTKKEKTITKFIKN